MGQDGAEDRVLIGGSYVGTEAVAAHINTVLGSRSGVVGAAWTTSLAATQAALAAGFPGEPSLDKVLAAAAAPANPFRTSPPARRA